MNDYKPPYDIRAVLVGDQRCGKTFAARRYFAREMPSQDYRIPPNYKKYDTFIPIYQQKVHFVLIDTGGSSSSLQNWLSDYDRKRDPWSSKANVVIISFDISNSKSLDNAIRKWYPEVRRHSQLVPIILAGLKEDRVLEIERDNEDDSMLCSDLDISNAKDAIDPTFYAKCSSKLDEGVNELFENAALISLEILQKCKFLHISNAPNDHTASELIKFKYGISLCDQYFPIGGDNLFRVLSTKGYKKAIETIIKLSKQKIGENGNNDEFAGTLLRENSNDKECIQTLLQAHIASDLTSYVTVHEVIRKILEIKGHIAEDSLKDLIKQSDDKGNNLLMLAAHNFEANDMSVFEKLIFVYLEADFSPICATNSAEENVLHILTRRGQMELVNVLVENTSMDNIENSLLKTLFTQKNTYGFNALMLAIMRIKKYQNWTTIFEDEKRKMIETFDKLLSYYYYTCPSAISLQNSDGENCFHICGTLGATEVMQIIIDHSTKHESPADIATSLGQKDNKGFIPLLTAANNKNIAAFDQLLTFYHQIDSKLLNITDRTGNTPLVWSAVFEKHLLFEKLLFLDPATISIQNSRGENFLHVISRTGTTTDLIDMAKNKLENTLRGSNGNERWMMERSLKTLISQKDHDGRTPLVSAAFFKKALNFQKMLSIYCQFDLSAIYIQNSNGENFAHIFSKDGYTDGIDILIQTASKFKEEPILAELFQQPDNDGNTPLMVAAKEDQSELLAKMLLFYYGYPRIETIEAMIHHKNNAKSTLLHIVQNASESMLGPHGIILELEKIVHIKENKEDEGLLGLENCLRISNGSSSKTLKSVKMVRDTIPNTSNQMIFIFLRLFIMACFFPTAMYLFDVISDSLMTQRFENDWKNESVSSSNKSYFEIILRRNYHRLPRTCNLTDQTLENIPECLSGMAKFMYSVFFIALPWTFYGYELYRNEFLTQPRKKVENWTLLQLGSTAGQKTFKYAILSLLILGSLVIWPLIAILRNFYYSIKYAKSSGSERSFYEEKKLESAKSDTRARLLEASIEATFQLVLQWYLLFPSVVKVFLEHDSMISEVWNNPIPYLSASSSILSLAWAFTTHKAAYKQGALDLTDAPFSRATLLLSALLLIISRVNCLILFMYYFGPGEFYPGMVFLFVHLILMICLHLIFHDDVIHFNEGNYFRFFHGCFLNGLANMFNNNGDVIMENERRTDNINTFACHFAYDCVFLLEHIILSSYGRSLDVQPHEYQDAKNMTIKISTIFLITGLLIKIVYYKTCHVWSKLIAVTRKDPRTNRLVFQTKFHFAGKIRNIEQQIC